MGNRKDKIEKKDRELLEEIEKLKRKIKILKSRKKYGLVWEEEKEPEQIVLDCQYKIPILKEVGTKKIITDKKKPMNILIEGDNYHALQVLNYTHKGKIDVIYIDPPYNTGARDWKYNNNYVEADDVYRHSKWLSFMNNRLKLAKNLLKKDGIICVTVDDYEMPRLWLLLEEIFGSTNHLGTVTIRNYPSGRKTKRKVAQIHEYALFFGKPDSSIKNLQKDFSEKSHKYVQDKDGSWYCPTNLRKQGIDSTALRKNGKISDRFYPIYYNPKTGEISSKKKLLIKILSIDPKGEKRIWRRGRDVIDEMYKRGDLWVQKTKYGFQVYFKFRGGLNGEPPKSIWYDSKFSASEHGTRILNEILGQRELFQYPKSVMAVEECIKASSDRKDAIILDFFAGSGTTGHAVLDLNKEDGENRKFILCTNNDNNICTEVCYPRIKKVIKGYKNPKGEKVEGLGSNLRYFKTELLDVDHISHFSDEQKIKLTYKAGEMIALREDTFEEVERNEWWQIFKNGTKYTAIYFKEDKSRLNELVKKLGKFKAKVILYIFSWGKNEYKNEFTEYKNIKVDDIPEPIIDVYKEVNRLS